MMKGQGGVQLRCFKDLDGVKKGWLEGCKKFLSTDACFLKTFLGDQLLAAVGKDVNDRYIQLLGP